MLWLLKKLFGKKKKKKTLKQRVIKWITILCIITLCITGFYFFTTILPLFMLSSATTTFVIDDDIIFTDNNAYKPPVGPAAGEGEAVQLSGGLEAMGVDFNKTISDLTAQLATAEDDAAKKTIRGKIAYAQLFQLLNAETELTDHPVMLLGTAMGIREMSLFSTKYSGIVGVMGGTDYDNGIYGTWCDKTINGLPNKGGGVISHVMTNAQSSILGQGGASIPAITFTDLSNNTTTSISINQTYSTVYEVSGSNANKALGYNKGAYGPIQIEANHWVSWVCPYVASSESYNSYLNQAYINIPITDKRFDSLYSAASGPVGGAAQSVVTSDNSHLANYRQNQTFIDNLMATIGHPNYIQEFANIVNNTPAGQATFGPGTGYYFAGRFTKGQDWEDWVMSLEAWPHAFTCFAVDRITSYCMFENKAELKNSGGNSPAGGSFKTKITEKFGADFTFVNETAEDIYWTLEMLQSWNYGAPNTNYSAEDRYYIGYLYRELANYIAVYGTSEIRATRPDSENCNPCAKCSSCSNRVSTFSGQGKTEQTACTNFAYNTYLNLANLVCKANGTRYNADGTDSEIYTKIHKALYNKQASSYHKNNYGYAITGLLDAEANTQAMMRDIFGLEDFSIFNYGGTADINGETSAPTLDGYNYNNEVPLSSAVDISYFSDAIFIGDGLTGGFAINSGCNAAGFFHKNGALCATILTAETLTALDGLSFNKVYIMIGVNEVMGTSSTFKSNYSTLIDTIRAKNPNATIYIQSILPVVGEFKNEYGTVVTNDQIQVQNNVLRKLAAEKHCFYVNVRDVFVNADKTFKTELYSSDIYLKPEANAVWLNYLCTHTVATSVEQPVETVTPVPEGE